MSNDQEQSPSVAEVAAEVAAEPFSNWCIVELMGHVRLAGMVTEERRFGVDMGRIDIPSPDGKFVTQYFSGAGVYRITPTTEEIARKLAASSPAPVRPWELRSEPALPSPGPSFRMNDDEPDGDEDFDDSDPYADE